MSKLELPNYITYASICTFIDAGSLFRSLLIYMDHQNLDSYPFIKQIASIIKSQTHKSVRRIVLYSVCLKTFEAKKDKFRII